MSAKKKVDLKKKFERLENSHQVTKTGDGKFIIDNDLVISENTILSKNNLLILNQQKKINIINNSTLFVEGEIYFKNNRDFPTLIFSQDETGSIIFNDK